MSIETIESGAGTTDKFNIEHILEVPSSTTATIHINRGLRNLLASRSGTWNGEYKTQMAKDFPTVGHGIL